MWIWSFTQVTSLYRNHPRIQELLSVLWTHWRQGRNMHWCLVLVCLLPAGGPEVKGLEKTEPSRPLELLKAVLWTSVSDYINSEWETALVQPLVQSQELINYTWERRKQDDRRGGDERRRKESKGVHDKTLIKIKNGPSNIFMQFCIHLKKAKCVTVWKFYLFACWTCCRFQFLCDMRM